MGAAQVTHGEPASDTARGHDEGTNSLTDSTQYVPEGRTNALTAHEIVGLLCVGRRFAINIGPSIHPAYLLEFKFLHISTCRYLGSWCYLERLEGR